MNFKTFKKYKWWIVGGLVVGIFIIPKLRKRAYSGEPGCTGPGILCPSGS